MTISTQTLFDLLGDFSALWPVDRIRAIPGKPLSAAPTPQVWLAALNNGVGISHVRAGVLDDRVGVEASLTLDNAKATFSGSPGAFPFVLASMPDVEFR